MHASSSLSFATNSLQRHWTIWQKMSFVHALLGSAIRVSRITHKRYFGILDRYLHPKAYPQKTIGHMGNSLVDLDSSSVRKKVLLTDMFPQTFLLDV